MAASKRPARGKMLVLGYVINICWISHELECSKNQVIDRIKPMSPMRLNKMACRAAVLASVRPYHHPIKRKDIMPTPSHPMKSWNRLLEVTKMVIVMRNKRRYLKNLFI